MKIVGRRERVEIPTTNIERVELLNHFELIWVESVLNLFGLNQFLG